MASVDVAWSALDRVTENDEFWFLRLVSKQMIILPKQHFTPGQQDELTAFWPAGARRPRNVSPLVRRAEVTQRHA